MPALLINGVNAETLGLTLAEAPGWLDSPPREIPTAAIAGRAGATAMGDVIEGTRQIPLIGTVRASTVASARGKVDAIKTALLASPLSLIFSDHPDRYINGHLKTFGVKLPQGAQGPFVQEMLLVEAMISALDPYFYDTELTANAPFGIHNPRPGGTGPIRPIFTLAGALATPISITLEDEVGSVVASMVLTLSTIAGDTLVIDNDAKTIKKNGVSVLSALTTGDFFTINPMDPRFSAQPYWYFNMTANGVSASPQGSFSFRRSWR